MSVPTQLPHPLYPLYPHHFFPDVPHTQTDIIQAWHNVVLPHHPAVPLSPYYLLIIIACCFAALFLLIRYIHTRQRAQKTARSTYVSVYSALSPTAQREWDSYMVSTVHAVIACLAGMVTMLYSMQQFYNNYVEMQMSSGIYSNTEIQIHTTPTLTLTDSVWFFLQTSLQPLSLPSASHYISGAPSTPPSSAAAAFSLAIQCAYSESYVRDCMLMITCGYLLFDLCFCIHQTVMTKQQTAGTSTLIFIHHVLILAAFIFGLYTHIGTFYMAMFLLNECSTIFLNCNYFLAVYIQHTTQTQTQAETQTKQTNNQNHNQHNHTLNNQTALVNSSTSSSSVWLLLYKLNAVCLLYFFFLSRVCMNVLTIVHIFGFSWYELQLLWRSGSVWKVNQTIQWQGGLLSLLAVCHVTINLIWFVKLIQAVWRKLNKEEPSAGVNGEREKPVAAAATSNWRRKKQE